ncbi:MAG TPA: excinuclease ABC subunit UvrC [Petrotogaceae bacterium]|jgi:excinuclease ABC subunit C|nr:excinuclease ABC subunit UvrC [Petrotogaceae bacterium]HQI79243.1 excinuclease ABC subunit UvrC [Petrotogaceae bacterium]
MLERELLKDIPHSPGVYIFRDSKQIPVYVGKAKDLKKRLSSYFNKANQQKNEKVLDIVSEADFLDYILTLNEDEAFILESNLIFTHKPKFNVLLKDARVYPYILVTSEKYPRITYVRNKNDLQGRFFGPYPDTRFVKDLIETAQKVYKIRSCDRSMDRKSKPCFLYHLGMCFAPCYKDVDQDEYRLHVDSIIDFLGGNVDAMKEYLSDAMLKYSKVLNFEKAAQMRDVYSKLTRLFVPLGVEFTNSRDFDVIMYEEPIFLLLRIRNGYLLSKLTFTLDGTVNDFLQQFYVVRNNEVPPYIYTMDDVQSEDDLKKYLYSKGLKKMSRLSQGENLFRLAFKNLEEEVQRFTTIGNTLKQAKEILSLSKIPQHIEGMDISHLQGMYTVASLIVFENGKPDKEQYRKYRLDEFKEPNDFESIRTVIRRRYSKHPLPDLLFIDGGKGQVNSALEALNELGFSQKDVDIIGIAKEDERIVFPGEVPDLHLRLDHPVLRMLIFLRDECHRFAIGFNRSLRSKRFEDTKLNDIKGIGSVRKKELMAKFGSIENIKKASFEEINEVICNRRVSEEIIKNFGGHTNGNKKSG